MTGGRSSTYQMPYGLLSFSDAELANPAVCKPVLFSQGNGRGASIYAPIPRKPCASIWHFLAIRPNLHSSVSVYNMVSKTMPKGASTVEGRGTLPPPAQHLLNNAAGHSQLLKADSSILEHHLRVATCAYSGC